MTRDEIIQRLRHIMKQSTQAKVDWNLLSPETTIASIGFDSLTVLDLIYDIQQQFQLEFPAEEIAGVKTVGQLADFLAGKLPQ